MLILGHSISPVNELYGSYCIFFSTHSCYFNLSACFDDGRVFTGGCSLHCACVSVNWIQTKSTQCSWTSYQWTTNGTGTRTTSRHGSSRAKQTHRLHTDSTRIPTRRSLATSCTKRSFHSKKSNSLTTKWTSVGR